MIDIHSHLLPGIDDGVQTEEEAKKILSLYKSTGITHIVCTPHLANPFVKTRILKIRDSYTWFRTVAESCGIEVILGSELYIGPDKAKFIPFLNKYLLVETSMRVEPLFLLDRIFELQLKGLTIILAHVERFSWLSVTSPTALRLREMGVYFQVNIQGIENGGAEQYMKENWVDFIATDNHGTSRRAPVNLEVFHEYPEIMARSKRILNL
ncbi:MAG: capsule biosynthesis protein CapC [Bacteroidetes bacterium]|nr:capsule biosynthesis protein CapC [Bacteroidota bacterium]